MSSDSEKRGKQLEAISGRFQMVIKKLGELAESEECLQARHLGGEDVSGQIAGIHRELSLYDEEKRRLVDMARQLGWTEDLSKFTASEAPHKRVGEMSAAELDNFVARETVVCEASRLRVNRFLAELDPMRSHRFAEKKNKLCLDVQLIDYEIVNIKDRLRVLYDRRARLAADVQKLEEDYRNWEPTI